MTDCPDDERRAALNGHRILVAEDEVPVAMMMEDTIIDAGGMVLGPVISVPDALGLLDAAKADGGVSAAVINLRLGQHRTTRLAAALRNRACPSSTPPATAPTMTLMRTRRCRCWPSPTTLRIWSRHWKACLPRLAAQRGGWKSFARRASHPFPAPAL
ncbi:hypothetical protein ACFQU7_27280 [Pseudoroseomonas wenyumeiae]